MATDVRNQIIRGSFGRVWLNGKKLANVKTFECKATLNYEEIDVNGELCKQNVYTGYSLAGTMTLHKIDSYVINLLKDAIASGSMPELKIVGAVADVDSDGSERVEIYNVTIDEMTLLKFENATIGEEEIPFKAGGFKFIDTID